MHKGRRVAKAMAIWMAAMSLLMVGARAGADAADAKPALSAQDRAAIEGVVRDYLKAHPELVLDALNALEAKDKAKREEAAKQAVLSQQDALKNDPTAYVAGNPKGDVTIVEFFDYNCPYCRSVAPEIQSLIADDKKLRVILKEWPIKGPDSIGIAQVSLAAAKQPKFLAFHFALLAEQDHVDQAGALAVAKKAGLDMDRLQKDMKAMDSMAIVRRNDELAQKIGVDGTPAFVIGNAVVPGAMPAEKLKQLIADVRKSCKQASC
jgi:protein-disulfide isomerase